MADNTYISIKVSGRPHENSGFQPLIVFNSPLINIEDVVYGGFSDVPYFFSVSIEENQVVYKLTLNRVYTSDKRRESYLFIAIAVPRGYKISNGYTPYEALNRLKEYIEATCLEPTLDFYGNPALKFKTSIINPNVLDEIGKEFPLETVCGPYRPMNSVGQIAYVSCSDEEAIKQLLNDVQYKEFSAYKEILVGLNITVATYAQIANLQIPRAPKFSKIVDGCDMGFVEGVETRVSVSGTKDNRYFINRNEDFSIAELRRGELIPYAKLDEENERVEISTVGLSTPRKVTVKIVFDRDPDYFRTNSKSFSLVYMNRPQEVSDYTFTLEGENIAKIEDRLNWHPRFAMRDKYVIRAIEGYVITPKGQDEYEFMVFTQQAGIRPQVGANAGVKAGVQTPIGSSVQDEIVKLNIQVTSGVYARKNANGSFYVYSKDGETDKVVYAAHVKFEELKEKNKQVYAGAMYLPKNQATAIKMCKVKYVTRDCVGVSDIILDNGSHLASNFKEYKKSFSERHKSSIIVLLVLILGLVFGSLVGAGTAYYFVDKHYKQKKEKIGTPTTYPCDKCPEEFDTQDKLTEHKQVKHSESITPSEKEEVKKTSGRGTSASAKKTASKSKSKPKSTNSQPKARKSGER